MNATPAPNVYTAPKQREGKPLTVSCQCGQITFPTPTVQPKAVYHCHCTECQKQSGSAFGTSAIFPSDGLFPLSEVLEAGLRVYTRPTDSGGSMDCYFCSACGSRLFHRLRDSHGQPKPTVSIKGGCIEGLNWKNGKHIYVRSAVIDLPAEWEKYDTMPATM